MDYHDRVWAEIDLDALAFTYRQIRKMAGAKNLMPVIKANAYGHGAVLAAREYKKEGASCFAVATADEALELRDAGIGGQILILGAVDRRYIGELVRRDVSLCVPGQDVVTMLREAAKDAPVRVHVKVDTGMHRLGFSPDQAVEAMAEIAGDPAFTLCGAFTHFAAAGEREQDEFTLAQHRAFETAVSKARERGVTLPMVHCSNSDAIVNFPQFCGDTARPGIILYGYASPSDRLLPLKPPLSLRSRIAQITRLEAGATVGYSRTWTADRGTLAASVSIGYADGLPRSGSNRIEMIVRGRRVPQIGRICMDMCMIDITSVPDAEVGDTVTVVGEDGGASVWMDELSDRSGTIPHEPLTQLTRRVVRRYFRGGREIEQP